MTIICEGGYIALSYLLMTGQFTYQSLYAANNCESTPMKKEIKRKKNEWEKYPKP